MKITLQDARESGYCCAWGAWRIAKRHGFDAEALRRFAGEGIEEEVLLALGDAQVAKVVEYVHRREGIA